MGKEIKGKYYIADCEHNGDIESAKSYLRSIGCTILGCYWDGMDCGLAYVTFSFDDSHFKEMYAELYSSSSFEADINDYLSFGELCGYKKMDKNEMNELYKQMCKDTSKGFLDRLPLHFFFKVNDGINPNSIIEKCLSFLKHPYKVLGYYFNVVDGCNYCTMLISSSYKNLATDIIGGEGIGDYCLGHRGWLSKNRIYGECSCSHILYNYTMLGGYEYFQRVVDRIKGRKELEYRGGTYYKPIDIKVEADEYFNADGTFLARIERNGKEYTIKDPRSWDWSEYRNK
jgi:hypothetical protein